MLLIGKIQSMISYKENGIGFNYRMAGVCIHNGSVLLHQMQGDTSWTLPGGRSELLEDTKTTVQREFKEESGYDVEVGRPLWFVENFFQHQTTQWHEVSLFYEVSFQADSACLKTNQFYGQEGDGVIVFKWFSLNDLEDIPLFPAFLRIGLNDLPEKLERIVVSK
jgi:ADP-ribose pyrophosphatase YjhB (NUDIX family)